MIIDDVNDSERSPLKGSQTVPPPPHLSEKCPTSFASAILIPPPAPAPIIAQPPRKRSRSNHHHRGRFRARKCLIAGSVALNCLLFLLLIRVLPRHTTIHDSSEDGEGDDGDGALSGGHLDVVSSSVSFPRVLMTVRHHSTEVRDRANVCWMERMDAYGLGIFTPAPFDGQTPKDRLEFKLTLLLPAGSGSSLPVYNLESRLPSFSTHLDIPPDSLEFDNLFLFSQNEPITAKSVFARNATVQTSNGVISGSFEASDALSLVTSNAPIDATVKLYNRNVFKTTELMIQTRNAQLQSDISLTTSSASGEGGKFDIEATTSDGPLFVTFPDSPTHSILTFNGQTSNSPANVWLNNAFEGEFALSSNLVFVDRRPFLDPRKLRSVFWEPLKNGMIVGSVRWKLPVWKTKIPGFVRVGTTNNLLNLYV
ncbi:ankyrin repeat family protein [Favolaschia claudopus]|uniref:Ankyrin repeat family protein n=1 Tax=Favolaschia claudopus TaxID=2862362 RepID=A0AAW0CU71_9AGAR